MDEKSIVNKDILPKKVRRNPLTGYVPHISVSGDFRDAYNLFACISPDNTKSRAVFFQVHQNNGNSESFVDFVIAMVNDGFLSHNEVLIMDNAKIHIYGTARTIEELLWETVVKGEPLRILIIYLPTRSPELNPIELIFHILSRRIRSFRYQTGIGNIYDHAVVSTAIRVLEDISFVKKTVEHCGYLAI